MLVISVCAKLVAGEFFGTQFSGFELEKSGDLHVAVCEPWAILEISPVDPSIVQVKIKLLVSLSFAKLLSSAPIQLQKALLVVFRRL